MYRFHPDHKTAALVLALSGLFATGMTVPAVAAAGSSTAPASSVVQASPAMKTMPAMTGDTMAASSATTALNLLEAGGYGDFANFHRDGGKYAATVVRDGRTMHLSVDPATGKIEKRDS